MARGDPRGLETIRDQVGLFAFGSPSPPPPSTRPPPPSTTGGVRDAAASQPLQLCEQAAATVEYDGGSVGALPLRNLSHAAACLLGVAPLRAVALDPHATFLGVGGGAGGGEMPVEVAAVAATSRNLPQSPLRRDDGRGRGSGRPSGGRDSSLGWRRRHGTLFRGVAAPSPASRAATHASACAQASLLAHTSPGLVSMPKSLEAEHASPYTV